MTVLDHHEDVGTDTAGAPRRPTDRGYALIDGDSHVQTASGIAGLYPYMTEGWRNHFRFKRAETNLFPLPLKFATPGNSPYRSDASEAPGMVPGSNPAFVVKDHLERHDIAAMVSTSLEAGAFGSGLANPDEAAVLCAAFNDYYLEQWCEYDSRFRYAITVSPQDPEQAAAEVARRGAHPGAAAIYMPWENVLIGNRKYDPIYRAAQEADLPILLHLSGLETVGQGAPVWPAGNPDTFAERRVGYPVFAWAHLGSLAMSGVLAKFPRLKFIFVELGFSWVLPALWRLDATWRATRIETPWLTRPPSEDLRGRVWFTTDNIDEPSRPGDLYKLIEMMGPEWLVYGSDYPHWDGDEPGKVLTRLDDAAMRRVMQTNAEAVFRLS
ncbi:MAG: amidohydrolase family protein [Microbacteriaceae bacterium]